MINQEALLKAAFEKGVISEEKVKEVINDVNTEKITVKDALLRTVDSEAIAKIESEFYNLPYDNLLETKIPEEVLHLISAEVAQNYKIICYEKIDSQIKVGITDPDNFKAIEAVDFLAKESGLAVKYALISEQSFQTAFRRYKSLSKELSKALEIRAEEEKGVHVSSGDEDEVNTEETTKSAPVAKIVSVIIRHAVEGGASDIHVEPLKKESRIRYRIDGILHTSLVLPRNVHRSIVARIKVMANMKLDETRIPQDGRFRLDINNREIDFRISTLPTSGTEKVVMRILDTSRGAPTLEELGFQGEQMSVLKRNMKKTEGLLLVTGPTGSGKSTTIFSVLDELNQEGVNISTLEDPVEYQLKGVNQSQIKPNIGYTFASGLRSLLRQDPDIIMVGEIRDEETAELAIHAALTGHFVLSTLHTTSAIGAIARLIDMGIEAFLIGSTLHTVIAQRLVRKICPHCKDEIKLPKHIIDDIKNELKNMDPEYIKEVIPDFDMEKAIFHQGKGCPRCGNSGYMGRLSIAEVIDVNRQLQETIKGGKKFLSIEDIKSNQKFITVKQDGFIKVIQGLTTIEEVLRVMKD